MLRLLSWLILVPLCAVTLYLAVANRHLVVFSLDPFDPANPAIAFELPLFTVVLAAVFLGMMIGALAMLAGRWRRNRQKAAAAKTAGAGKKSPTSVVPVKIA